MDTLTHIALGACVGEAMLGKRLGKKALLIGAFANSIPDFDFIVSLWASIDQGLLAHRAFSHSFLFAILISILLAFIFQKWFRIYNILLRTWMIFFIVEIFLHLFIDVFNNYGVGWFEPFSHTRLSFNAIFVVDPFYSIWLGIACIVLLIIKTDHRKRKLWLEFGLGISTFYWMYCVGNKIKTDSDFRYMLKKQNISYTQYFTTPTPLNNWLWYVVAGNDSGYHIGYYSVFDKQKRIDLHYYPKNDFLLDTIKDHIEVQRLLRFSQGFYTVEKWNDTLVFNDLRFGQVVGWYKPQAKFAFHYYLEHKYNNKFVVQRGRFAEWNWKTTRSLIKRIKGN